MKLITIFLVLLSAYIHCSAQEDVPTLFPYEPFNPVDDADKLEEALSGVFTDEMGIINVMCYRTTGQRVNISSTYSSQFGSDLAQDFKRKLAGEFSEMMVYMTYPIGDYLATELYRVMGRTGLSTDHLAMTEILISRTNAEIAATNVAYERLFKVTLISDIDSISSLNGRDLLITLAEGLRYEGTNVVTTDVVKDSNSLNRAATAAIVDQTVFVDIFSHKSYRHLARVEADYKTRFGTELMTTVQTVFNGQFRDSLAAILEFTESKAQYFARRMRDSMNGLGTEKLGLTRHTVSRAELNLESVKGAYATMYSSSLPDDIKRETSGSHLDALLALIK